LNGLGERLRNGLNERFAQKNIAAQAVGVGSLFSIYFTAAPLINYRSLTSNDGAMTQRVFLALLNQGYFLSQGLGMNALSLPMTTEQIDGLIAAVDQAIDQARL